MGKGGHSGNTTRFVEVTLRCGELLEGSAFEKLPSGCYREETHEEAPAGPGEG